MTNFYAEIVCEPGDLSAARLNRFLDAASAELGCRITSARIDLIGPGSKLQKFRLHAEVDGFATSKSLTSLTEGQP